MPQETRGLLPHWTVSSLHGLSQCLCLYMYICIPDAHGGQRALDPLGLDFQSCVQILSLLLIYLFASSLYILDTRPYQIHYTFTTFSIPCYLFHSGACMHVCVWGCVFTSTSAHACMCEPRCQHQLSLYCSVSFETGFLVESVDITLVRVAGLLVSAPQHWGSEHSPCCVWPLHQGGPGV